MNIIYVLSLRLLLQNYKIYEVSFFCNFCLDVFSVKVRYCSLQENIITQKVAWLAIIFKDPYNSSLHQLYIAMFYLFIIVNILISIVVKKLVFPFDL